MKLSAGKPERALDYCWTRAFLKTRRECTAFVRKSYSCRSDQRCRELEFFLSLSLEHFIISSRGACEFATVLVLVASGPVLAAVAAQQ
eukprot:6169894-Amphidinium_carterae.1